VLRQRLRELATAGRASATNAAHPVDARRLAVGRNRVHRLYKLEGLQVRMRVRRRKRISLHRGPAPVATSGGQYWAMDFVHDQLSNGRKFRVLTVIDKWHRQCIALQADFALTGYSVVDAMNAIARNAIALCDNCRSWNGIHVQSARRVVLSAGVKLDFIRPASRRERVHRVVQRSVA